MKKIVTIGGGTGSFTLLSGLKNYSVDISAVVSMADDGGSTGRLSGDLKGHNFGNLLLSALEKINGNFTNGIKDAAKILNIKGRVLPVSEKDMNLAIEIGNGEIIVGEKYLDHNKRIRKYGVKKVFLRPKIKANKNVIQAIKNANLIILGPGDHYGSIIPNLLVSGITNAIKNSKATVVYNCNLTNKKGQTENFDVDKYTQEMNRYLGGDRIDYVVCSSNRPKKDLIEKYEKKEGENSIVQFHKNSSMERSYRIVKADITRKTVILRKNNDAMADTRSFIRHDSKKLAKVMMLLSEREVYKHMIKEII